MSPPSLNLMDNGDGKVYADVSGVEAVSRHPETAPLKARKLNGAVTKYYTRQEVLQHDQEDDCWLIVNGSVYNVTKWIPRHPGQNSMATDNLFFLFKNNNKQKVTKDKTYLFLP